MVPSIWVANKIETFRFISTAIKDSITVQSITIYDSLLNAYTILIYYNIYIYIMYISNMMSHVTFGTIELNQYGQQKIVGLRGFASSNCLPCYQNLTIHQEFSALNMDYSDYQLTHDPSTPHRFSGFDWATSDSSFSIVHSSPRITAYLSLLHIYIYYIHTYLIIHNCPLRLPGMWPKWSLPMKSTQIGETTHLGELGALGAKSLLIEGVE